jgi:hypothetical protein
MAKRVRGTRRPGQRRPIQRSNRPAAAPAAPAAPAGAALAASGLTAAEEARAAELERGLVEQERAAEAARGDRARAATREEPIPVARGGSRAAGAGLAARYAHEYDYVNRDLRRIAILATSLTGVMVVLWILIDVLDVIKV